jgi:hypothetical protein
MDEQCKNAIRNNQPAKGATDMAVHQLNSKYPFPTNAQEMLAALQRQTNPSQWKMQFVRASDDDPRKFKEVFFIEDELTDTTPNVSCEFGSVWVNLWTGAYLYDFHLYRLNEGYCKGYSWLAHLQQKLWYQSEMGFLIESLEEIFPPSAEARRVLAASTV